MEQKGSCGSGCCHCYLGYCTTTNSESFACVKILQRRKKILFDSAIHILTTCNNGVTKVLLARLLKLNGDTSDARQTLESISEVWLQLHPQVVVERDKLLRSIGKQTIPEREQWLNKVNALKDEWVIERRIQLLIDKNEIQQAKDLLMSTQWQKVHQTYTRTGLWKQICDKQGVNYLPVPLQLGEDRLARFGAYREYE